MSVWNYLNPHPLASDFNKVGPSWFQVWICQMLIPAWATLWNFGQDPASRSKFHKVAQAGVRSSLKTIWLARGLALRSRLGNRYTSRCFTGDRQWFRLHTGKLQSAWLGDLYYAPNSIMEASLHLSEPPKEMTGTLPIIKLDIRDGGNPTSNRQDRKQPKL